MVTAFFLQRILKYVKRWTLWLESDILKIEFFASWIYIISL